MSKILYFTSWYREAHPERLAELQTCVQNCIDSPDLDEVHLLCEGGAVFTPNQNGNEHKLRQEMVAERSMYTTFFEYANKVAQEDDICVLANVDIYPSPDTRILLNELKSNEAWTLSRWDIMAQGDPVCLCKKDSADVWVMRAPIRKVDANFFLGVPGCDNAVAMRLLNAGYEVSNPCKDVKFYHYHLTGVHNYTGNDTVPHPYLLVEPTNIGVEAGKYRINWQPSINNPLTYHTKG